MKALVYTNYGGVDQLSIKEVEKPVPEENEVLVRIHAVSLNDWDFGLMHGDFINRMLNGWRKPKRQILGSDIAGIIEAVGKEVKKFKVGDEVYGDLSGQWGGLAEYCTAPEKSLERKPSQMSFVDAAAIPQAGMLAVQGLIDKGKIKKGEKILINGAGGGVGTMGVQIAKLFETEVTGVDSDSKLEMMRSIGFDHVIDYKKEDFTRSHQRYDLVLDTKSNRSLHKYARVLKKGGRYITVGGAISKLLLGLPQIAFFNLFTGKRMALVNLKTNKDLLYMNELYTQGKLKLIIDGPFKLEDFRSAFELFEKAEHKGKVVLTL